MRNYLLDKDFLKEICSSQNRKVFACVTIFDEKDTPLELIEGMVTSGSVNIDGNSSTRRSCSLTIASNNLNIHDFYWVLKAQFELEIGLENDTQQYADEQIIWFPMGRYLISSFSKSVANTGLANISIQGKDKMNKLNGEMGGKFTALTNCGKLDEEQKDGSIITSDIVIPDIIKNLVGLYGGELLGKIIINDLDPFGLALKTYNHDSPLYVLINEDGSPAGKMWDSEGKIGPLGLLKVSEISEEDLYHYDLQQQKYVGKLFSSASNSKWSAPFRGYIKKIQAGDSFGYVITDLIYPSDLIANAGDTITSILDKIKAMLGDYEYFYDIYGNFIFQKQKAYKSFKDIALNNKYSESFIFNYDTDLVDYTMSNLDKITSISNSPQLNNIKNDYSLWATRKTINGGDQYLHCRYAIDIKPTDYTTLPIDSNLINKLQKKYSRFKDIDLQPQEAILYTTNANIESAQLVDWREIIYRMAFDYNRLHDTEEYYLLMKQYNPQYPHGKTGYENYYTDINGFWRDIYQTDSTELHYKSKGNNYLKDNIEYRIYDGDTEKGIYQRDFTSGFNNAKYLYGPVILNNGQFKRTFYGEFDSIIETNYNILQRYYLVKSALKQKETNESDGLNQLIEENMLYYYDSSTCIDATVEKNESEDENDNMVYGGFINAKNEQKYHPLCIQHDDDALTVKSYWHWDPDDSYSAIESSEISLFDGVTEWFCKYIKDKESEDEEDTFYSIGTFYPIDPLTAKVDADSVDISRSDETNLKKMAFKPFLKQNLNKWAVLLEIEKDKTVGLSADNYFKYAKDFYLNNSDNISTIDQPSSQPSDESDPLRIIQTGLTSYKLNNSEDEKIQYKNQQLDGNYRTLCAQYIALQTLLQNEVVNSSVPDSTIRRIIDTAVKNNGVDSFLLYNYNYLTFDKIDSDGNIFLKIWEENPKAGGKNATLVESELWYLKNNIILPKNITNSNRWSTKLTQKYAETYNRIRLDTTKDNYTKQFTSDYFSHFKYILNQIFVDPFVYATNNSKAFDEYLSTDKTYQYFIQNQDKYFYSAEMLSDKDFLDDYNNSTTNGEATGSQKAHSICNDSNGWYHIFSIDIDLVQPESTFSNTGNWLFDITSNIVSQVVSNIKFWMTELGKRKGNNSNFTLIDYINIIALQDVGALKSNIIIKTWDLQFDKENYWKKDVAEAPEKLTFWFDFLDSSYGDIIKYSVQNIGQRQFVKTDNNIAAIKYSPTLDVVYYETSYEGTKKLEQFQELKTGYVYLPFNTDNFPYYKDDKSEIDYYFVTSSQGKTMIDIMENYIYNYAYAVEPVSFSCIPQYFLEPNSKIAIYDNESGINGEYIVSKISFNLAHNSTMNITANRAIEKPARRVILDAK